MDVRSLGRKLCLSKSTTVKVSSYIVKVNFNVLDIVILEVPQVGVVTRSLDKLLASPVCEIKQFKEIDVRLINVQILTVNEELAIDSLGIDRTKEVVRINSTGEREQCCMKSKQSHRC